MNRRSNSRLRGQALTENIITVALIAIATIGITSVFGDNVRLLFAASSDAIAGNSQVRNPGSRTGQAPGLTRKTLSTFGKTNASGGTSGGGGPNSNSPINSP